jgi:hypothetical protein
MKARYKGRSSNFGLLENKVYEILAVEADGLFYRVVDETGEDYLYFAEDFDIIDGTSPQETSSESLFQRRTFLS